MTPLFSLPASTIVDKVVPKNSFDKYTSAKQRKQFSECVEKIRWVNKLSAATTNLHGKDILEIEVFDIQLKKKADISELLKVIDRAIPYPIIFIIRHSNEISLSAAEKHPNPADENKSVVDWTFNSGWFNEDELTYKIVLQTSIDSVFIDFCKQLSGRSSEKLSLQELIAKEQKTKEIKRAIIDLRAAIKATRQFNKKVELNLKLNAFIRQMEDI